MAGELSVGAYTDLGHDRVRETFETEHLGCALSALLDVADGAQLLDLGCADGLAARLVGPRLTRYVGVDLAGEGTHVRHDLRDGLGPVGALPFDVYLASFGLASHLAPEQLRRLVRDISTHARPGALVALEALGQYSLEWPRLWDSDPGEARTIAYALGGDVAVHPWAPAELAVLLESNGVEPLHVIDRSVQAGPKLGMGRYWRGLPPLREALNTLSAPVATTAEIDAARATLTQPLPPLPAGPAAALHQDIAARRSALLSAYDGSPGDLARAVWALEAGLGGGFGHGLMIVGRVA